MGIISSEPRTTDGLVARIKGRTGETVTRNILWRLRRQYAGRFPEPQPFGHSLAWSAEAEDFFVGIIAEERRLREARR